MRNFKFYAFFVFCIFLENGANAQTFQKQIKNYGDSMVYRVVPDKILVYEKPRPFRFVARLPSDMWTFCKQTFRLGNLPQIGALAAGTAYLVRLDQDAADASQQFGRWVGLNPERQFKTVWEFDAGGKHVNAFEIPDNLNTALYYLGEGWTSIALGLSIWSYGMIKKDYRAQKTAGQLFEAFITMGITVQLIKRTTGRQSPFRATEPGGKWSPLPNPSEYQNNVPNYDAFPSGHMATMMATVTILAENYPEKKFIKPLGYSLMTLHGYSMMNNEVHWLSDYPLAIAIGYLYGKIISGRDRKVYLTRNKSTSFLNNIEIMPAVIPNSGIGLALRYSIK